MRKDAHRVLLVDDDLDEQFLTNRALKKSLSAYGSVFIVRGADQAIEYLIGEGRFADRTKHPFPSIIITDLNMPNGDGFKVLEFLRSNPAWSVVPRIMFTSSEADDDVRIAFSLGASAYHVKPPNQAQREACMQQMLEYWATSRVPPVDVEGRLLPMDNLRRRAQQYPQEIGGDKMERPSD